MVSKFIKLTLDNTDDEEVSVNLDHVVQFVRRPGAGYTVVELSNGNSITVKESPDDIWTLEYHGSAG